MTVSPHLTAFLRVEHVLLDRTPIQAAAWLAARQRHVSSRLARLGATALSATLQVGPFHDPVRTLRLAFRALQGCSEDRLIVLGEDWFDEHVRGHLRPAGLQALARARARGARVVLLSELPHRLIAPLQIQLGADHLLCNHLEAKNGVLTGALGDPVVTATMDVRQAGRLAGLGEVHASSCLAYGGTSADATLLASAGWPCAVAPDRSLARLARTCDWPVLTV